LELKNRGLVEHYRFFLLKFLKNIFKNPLKVQRTGRNVGLIVGEEKASAVFTSLSEEGNNDGRRGGSIPTF